MKKFQWVSVLLVFAVLMGGCASGSGRSFSEDGVEVLGGADGVKLRIRDAMLFDFDRSELRSDASRKVDRLAKIVNRSSKPVEVNGYTDDSGTDAYNVRLSTARAKAVMQALVVRGVKASRISVHGMGARDPVVANDTEEGRARNRRVEVVLVGEKLKSLTSEDDK